MPQMNWTNGKGGKVGCEAVVVVTMWKGNSWRLCVSLCSQMSSKIWKILKNHSNGKWFKFLWRKIIRSSGHFDDDYDDVELLYNGKKMVGEKWRCPVRPHCKICQNLSMHASKGSLKMFVSWNQKDSKYLNIGTVQHCTLLGHLCKTLVGVCSVVIFPQIMNIIAAYWSVKMCKNYSISCKWGHKNHNSTIVFPLMKIDIRSLPLWRFYL